MKVAIAGYGVEGKCSYQYYLSKGDDVTIIDERLELIDLEKNAKTILGPNAFDDLSLFDIVIRSPGLAPEKLASAQKIWSATNEFFATCPALIIGVTGTKGKGTASSLIASIFKAASKNVHLVGNIGQPALSVLPDIQPQDVVVYELSSFQLWDVEKSPNIAVVLMIEPDHLDVHVSFNDYLAAKSNIAKFQSVNDVTLYAADNEHSQHVANHGKGEKGLYRSTKRCHIENNNFVYKNQILCSLDSLSLVGNHNLENACAAISAVMEFTQVSALDVRTGLLAFKGLPHRLRFVREVHGVKYYDDSIATTPGSAIAALRSFESKKIIILGGSDKGADYEQIIKVCKSSNSEVIAIGKMAESITKLCQKYSVTSHCSDKLMTNVVSIAAKLAKPGDVVLLSPASASFDQYLSYADRGEQFIAAVEAL